MFEDWKPETKEIEIFNHKVTIKKLSVDDRKKLVKHNNDVDSKSTDATSLLLTLSIPESKLEDWNNVSVEIADQLILAINDFNNFDNEKARS